MLHRLAAALLALACTLLLAVSGPALAAQGSGCMPTTGTVSGLTFAQDVNAAIAALISSNSGASAPATDCSAAAIKGQLWVDTSVTPNILKQYDGTGWVILGYLDASNHIWTPPLGGNTATVASASTADIWAVSPAAITISGTTTITRLAAASAVPGTFKVIKFAGVLTLTYDSAALILPTAANITTATGDYALVVALTNTNVAVVSYTKADGTPLFLSPTFTGAVFFNGAITPAALASNTNDWNPAGLSTANTIRVSASSSITLSGLTAPASAGQRIVLHNVGTSMIALSRQDANSAAANRFLFAAAIQLLPDRTVDLIYDSTSSRWRLTGAWLNGGMTSQELTSGSGATYTTPTGATRLFIRQCGGGGGTGGTGSSGATNGGAGGATSFNGIVANGGGLSALVSNTGGGGSGAGGASGAGSASYRRAGQNGSGGVSANAAFVNSFGGAGGIGPFGGGAAIGPGNAGAVPQANSCSGGAGAPVASASFGSSGGGGAGEYVEIIINAPAASYTYTVGAAGTTGAGGTGGAGGNGGSAGDIIVHEFYNFLLKRDLERDRPGNNDNTPAFLRMVA